MSISKIVKEPALLLKRPSGLQGLDRLKNFSDGVFAIVITLLIFQLKIPDLTTGQVSQELPKALLDLVPSIAGYVISFILLGIYWVGHHAMFTFIKRYDRNLLWLNIVFLMFIALMPFPTGLLIRYNTEQVSMVVYCSVLILTGLSALVMWRHASRHHRLIEESLPMEIVSLTYRRVILAPLGYLLAMGVSFLSMDVAKLLLIGIILIYLIPNPLTQLHRHYGHQKPEAG